MSQKSSVPQPAKSVSQALMSDTAQHEFRVYISTAGRLFSRLINNVGRGTGSRDEVGSGGNNKVASQFRGQTMTLVIKGGNHARQIIASFDGIFSNCSAQVMRGKQQGTGPMIATSLINGRKMEIQSVSVSGATCSVRSGNVFERE